MKKTTIITLSDAQKSFKSKKLVLTFTEGDKNINLKVLSMNKKELVDVDFVNSEIVLAFCKMEAIT
ncbi:hypothetical protein [Nitrosopumilus spindle-shaped virus]|uniref:Uncharacterized protein n=1 Tax=Nitrosopumilus spindle-shaped virus TaxID=2508184 RepID=A0A514K389_9VIRU|nr:hypothetical protein [Nitrosopumilus spindle-shaped virus]